MYCTAKMLQNSKTVKRNEKTSYSWKKENINKVTPETKETVGTLTMVLIRRGHVSGYGRTETLSGLNRAELY